MPGEREEGRGTRRGAGRREGCWGAQGGGERDAGGAGRRRGRPGAPPQVSTAGAVVASTPRREALITVGRAAGKGQLGRYQHRAAFGAKERGTKGVGERGRG